MTTRNTKTDGTEHEEIQQRGVYLMADTPLTALPLALEDGSGDKNLLAECLVEQLAEEEVDRLISDMISQRVNGEQDGTSIVCEDCGHVRETTERYPTLVNCEECGSYDLRYADAGTDQ